MRMSSIGDRFFFSFFFFFLVLLRSAMVSAEICSDGKVCERSVESRNFWVGRNEENVSSGVGQNGVDSQSEWFESQGFTTCYPEVMAGEGIMEYQFNRSSRSGGVSYGPVIMEDIRRWCISFLKSTSIGVRADYSMRFWSIYICGKATTGCR
jgi:hypothetical protein